jgi:hypothetical protein
LQHAGKIFLPLTQTSNFLVTVNSSVNFIIYCIFGEKFKRIFLRSMFELMGRDDYSQQNEIIRYPNNSTSSLHRNQSILLLQRAGAAASLLVQQGAVGNSSAILLPRGGSGASVAGRLRTGSVQSGPLYVNSCSELTRQENTTKEYVFCGLPSCANLAGSSYLRDKVFLLRSVGRNVYPDSKADDNYN